MQKIVTPFITACVLCLFLISCKKDDNILTPVTPPLTTIGQSYSDCSMHTVTLCNKKNGVLGSLTIVNNVFGHANFVFTVNNPWKVMQVELFAGNLSDLPRSPSGKPIASSFPHRQSPEPTAAQDNLVMEVDNLTLSYVVSAKVLLTRANKNGNESITVWADGCDADGSHNKDQDGNYFTNTVSGCAIVEASFEDVPTCSKDVNTVMGLDPTYNITIPWTFATISMANETYTESEARAIAALPELPLNIDAKFAFKVLGTLKQSQTDIQASSFLAPNAKVIENWLIGKGKISKSNLPACPKEVKESAAVINSWIAGHICLGRR